jgi:hypothetical protein
MTAFPIVSFSSFQLFDRLDVSLENPSSLSAASPNFWERTSKDLLAVFSPADESPELFPGHHHAAFVFVD